MRCISCGLENRPDVLFCENCGTKIQQPAAPPAQNNRFCPDCGSIVRPGVIYCENCGHSFQSAAVLNRALRSPSPNASTAHQVRVTSPKNEASRGLVIGGIVVTLLLLGAFWSRIINVRALPSSTSPALARATSRLSIFQANLPRPIAISNAVTSFQNKNNPVIIKGNQNNEVCGAAVDLSISKVSETHSFSQTGLFNSAGLIYQFKNAGQSMTGNKYGYHAEWYVQTKPGGGVDTVTDKHYYCSGWENNTLTCMAPDWRGAQSARISIVYDDPNCPFEVASFGFEGENVYAASEPASICKDNIEFELLSVSPPKGDSRESEYCFHYFGGFTNFWDYYAETEPIDKEGPPLFHGAYWYKSYTGFNEDGVACFENLTPLVNLYPEQTGVFWKIINKICNETVSSGIFDQNTGVAISGTNSGSSSNTKDQTIDSCESLPSLKFNTIVEIGRDERIVHNQVIFDIMGDYLINIANRESVNIKKKIPNGGWADSSTRCDFNYSTSQLTCSELFPINEPAEFEVYLEKWTYDPDYRILCSRVLYTHLETDTTDKQEDWMYDHCRAIENTVITTVPLGWQKNDTFLLYYRFGGGVWGLMRGLPGDPIPWEYQTGLGKGTDFESGTCHMESYNDRLFCSYPSSASRWAGHSVDVSVNAVGCKEYRATIVLPTLIKGPTPTPIVDVPIEPGCGPEPDPLDYPKSRTWCECNGGTYELYMPPESGGPAGYCVLP
jgi:hypothetical protein